MAKLLIMSVVSFCFIFLLLVFFRYILKRYFFNYSLNYKVWYLTVLAGLIPFIPIKFSFIKFNNVNNQAPTVEIIILLEPENNHHQTCSRVRNRYP